MTRLIDPVTGKPMRRDEHETKLQMLLDWLRAPTVLHAIGQHIPELLEHEEGEQSPIVKAGALIGATLSASHYGTPGESGVDEQVAGELMYQLLDERHVRRAIAKSVRKAYGLPWRDIVRQLRAFHRELEREQPVDEEPFKEQEPEVVH